MSRSDAALLDRRQFIAAAVAAGTVAAGARAQTPAAFPRPPVCVFSKHLQFLDYRELAKACKKIGVDGVDLTVRDGGHVTPERVAQDLPRAVEAIRAEGLDVPMITTALYSAGGKEARAILTTAASQGIPCFRVGGQKYAASGDPLAQLPAFTEELRSLARLAEECGITAGYHNHSGYNNVGAALWDLHSMITAIGSQRLGANFDLGHAKVEGAYGAWQTNARLMAPLTKMMAAKDFVWEKDKPKWVPLGQGIVPIVEMLKIFREQAAYGGPISLHFEYPVSPREAMLEEVRAAVQTLRRNLDEAGYA